MAEQMLPVLYIDGEFWVRHKDVAYFASKLDPGPASMSLCPECGFQNHANQCSRIKK